MHLGDIGAICNDAAFAMMLAQTQPAARGGAALRRRGLRPPPAARPDRARRGGGGSRRRRRHAAIRALIAEIRGRFPRLVDLYDNTASLLNRTVGTGHAQCRSGAPLWRRRLCRPRLGPRFRRPPRPAPMRPMTGCNSRCRLRSDGDVNARVWMRIREVEQSCSLITQMLNGMPPGPIRADLPAPGARPRGWGWSRASAATSWFGWRSTPRAGSPAATCAIRPGSSGRFWRPRSRTTSSPTSRSATNPSTAPIPGRISERRTCEVSARRTDPPAADRTGARPPTPPRSPSLARRCSARRGRGSAAASPSARSMPARAMAANWRSAR